MGGGARRPSPIRQIRKKSKMTKQKTEVVSNPHVAENNAREEGRLMQPDRPWTDPGIGIKIYTSQEVATMLASLRFWQEALNMEHNGRDFMPDYFKDEEPLTVQEIDDLCEKINAGGEQ